MISTLTFAELKAVDRATRLSHFFSLALSSPREQQESEPLVGEERLYSLTLQMGEEEEPILTVAGVTSGMIYRLANAYRNNDLEDTRLASLHPSLFYFKDAPLVWEKSEEEQEAVEALIHRLQYEVGDEEDDCYYLSFERGANRVTVTVVWTTAILGEELRRQEGLGVDQAIHLAHLIERADNRCVGVRMDESAELFQDSAFSDAQDLAESILEEMYPESQTDEGDILELEALS